jgi:hypothetical protein
MAEQAFGQRPERPTNRVGERLEVAIELLTFWGLWVPGQGRPLQEGTNDALATLSCDRQRPLATGESSADAVAQRRQPARHLAESARVGLHRHRRTLPEMTGVAVSEDRKWHYDCRVGPDLAAPRSDGSARMTAAVLYQAFADACADHRCTSDPDVAVIIHEVQKDMELFTLGQQRRLPDDGDPASRPDYDRAAAGRAGDARRVSQVNASSVR